MTTLLATNERRQTTTTRAERGEGVALDVFIESYSSRPSAGEQDAASGLVGEFTWDVFLLHVNPADKAAQTTSNT